MQCSVRQLAPALSSPSQVEQATQTLFCALCSKARQAAKLDNSAQHCCLLTWWRGPGGGAGCRVCSTDMAFLSRQAGCQPCNNLKQVLMSEGSASLETCRQIPCKRSKVIANDRGMHGSGPSPSSVCAAAQGKEERPKDKHQGKSHLDRVVTWRQAMQLEVLISQTVPGGFCG